MRIERCSEDCYDLSNLQAAGEQLSKKMFEMKDKFDTCLYFSVLFISENHSFSKGLTIAVFILVGNWQDNIEVLMIWMSVGRMSSSDSSRREVGM